MRIKPGEQSTGIQLPSINGTIFDTGSLQGRPYLSSFFRFASCPFCNLRVHQLVESYAELGNDFTIVAVFDSPIDNLVRHAEGHKAPFQILADESNRYYREYGIEHSFAGMMKGMLLRMPTLIRSMSMGYVPTIIKGSMTTMPADFLIDARGVIRTAHYGGDEGDHLPFEQVKDFSLGILSR